MGALMHVLATALLETQVFRLVLNISENFTDPGEKLILSCNFILSLVLGVVFLLEFPQLRVPVATENRP